MCGVSTESVLCQALARLIYWYNYIFTLWKLVVNKKRETRKNLQLFFIFFFTKKSNAVHYHENPMNKEKHCLNSKTLILMKQYYHICSNWRLPILVQNTVFPMQIHVVDRFFWMMFPCCLYCPLLMISTKILWKKCDPPRHYNIPLNYSSHNHAENFCSCQKLYVQKQWNCWHVRSQFDMPRISQRVERNILTVHQIVNQLSRKHTDARKMPNEGYRSEYEETMWQSNDW